MKLPIIRGVVRRCLLVNFRVDPAVMRDFLPEPFEPALHEGWAFDRCRICGESAGWTPCVICGLPIKNPLLG